MSTNIYPFSTTEEDFFVNWIVDLNFYKIEIKICELSLESLLQKESNNWEVLPHIEHFQNQFIIQKENIYQLKQKTRRFWQLTKHLNDPLKGRKNKRYGILTAELNAFREYYNELLLEFECFIKLWL